MDKGFLPDGEEAGPLPPKEDPDRYQPLPVPRAPPQSHFPTPMPSTHPGPGVGLLLHCLSSYLDTYTVPCSMVQLPHPILDHLVWSNAHLPPTQICPM